MVTNSTESYNKVVLILCGNHTTGMAGDQHMNNADLKNYPNMHIL